MTLTEIKQILEQRGLRPLKQLGQNFLFDQNICRTIVDALALDGDDGGPVLEIGPGLGALTGEMVERGFQVTALEIDKGLAAFLRERFEGKKNFTLVEGDALKTLPGLGSLTRVIGNLPYNISTPLLMQLARQAAPDFHGVFMLQKEIAQRLDAAPRTEDYNAVSVLLQTLFRIEQLRTLSGNVFYPPPRVDSAVVRLSARPVPLLAAGDQESFHQFVRQGFSQRRKMLRKLLPVDLECRAEELSVEQWVELYGKTGRHL